MRSRALWYCVTLAGVFSTGLIGVQIARAAEVDALGVQQLRQLLNDNTWEMRLQGPYMPPTYWDWSADGSVCARILGSNKDDNCVDNGKWRIEGDVLCWKLEWYGKTEGLYSGCVDIETVSEGSYKAVRKKSGSDIFWFVIAE